MILVDEGACDQFPILVSLSRVDSYKVFRRVADGLGVLEYKPHKYFEFVLAPIAAIILSEVPESVSDGTFRGCRESACGHRLQSVLPRHSP